eukprot:12883280-Prorocentrum_lima.AAC.1
MAANAVGISKWTGLSDHALLIAVTGPRPGGARACRPLPSVSSRRKPGSTCGEDLRCTLPHSKCPTCQ